jgi:hypothetical protein
MKARTRKKMVARKQMRKGREDDKRRGRERGD